MYKLWIKAYPNRKLTGKNNNYEFVGKSVVRSKQ